ncbi:biosynthetic-type acetolactate synthase large subunit [Alkalilimnicola sp. S0819]|uniref:biosynthetic-type acetolactate synthase large subunit n=1 Tax=Alkalilimnicola sp. S0819 TaxID=2613922 RepID=UPI0012624B09|nr:biosynthetic-type acetolactate synthase large subunit [Alkalilimnicola sp. S0819]KAB7622559.1 biosynthetic-type acetolactate synthase large subunit [Alkalilimnicola sp. S0819]MPQ17446.1 biosynthetic-type acetolactate synthase large subunit [Alkalilimnicola sp. S0819]
MSNEIARKHPLAGTRMSGADVIIQVLADEGVDTVFGYSGGAILPTYDAIFRYNEGKGEQPEEQVKLIVPANEQGAGFMAAGYARASGKVGVFMVTSGPGATNTVTPIRDCMADSIPVVALTGQVGTSAMGTDAFQEAPIVNIMGSCAKHVFLVTDPSKLEATIRTAFEVARSGRPGPVVVDLPKDVQNWIGEYQGEGLLEIRGYRQRMESLRAAKLSERKCRQFFDMLQRSSRPLIYAGGGVISGEAARELREFSETWQIPVVTTLMGLGAVDTTSDLSLHMLGMHGAAFANYAVEDCDFLIAVGARFDDRVAARAEQFAPLAEHVAHIDIDAAEIGKVKMVDWAHVGEAGRSLRQLIDYGREQRIDIEHAPWVEHVRALKQRHAWNYDRESDLIQPHYVIEELNKLTDGRAIIATGVGQHQMWAAQYFDFREPRLWLTSGSMGTMGFGLPAAIGAAFACPDKIVIDVDGDGSIRMNLGEMETVTTYDLPVKVLLLNNLGDGMVRQWQKLYFEDRFSGSDKSLHRKDFVKAAESDGFPFVRRVSDKAELVSALKDFVEAKGPAFLEVMIDADAGVYPMVGPGMTYKQMVTGDHIASRDEGAEREKVRLDQSSAF